MSKSYTKSQLRLYIIIFCFSALGYAGMYIRGIKFLSCWFLISGFLAPVGMCFFAHIREDYKGDKDVSKKRRKQK